MDQANLSDDFVLPSTAMEAGKYEELVENVTPYKSPTKRIAERLHGQKATPESPDMKFARNRLGNLLTSIRKGDVPPVSSEKLPIVEEEKRPGPGRPRRSQQSNKHKPGEVIFEMRGKTFSLREDRTSCTEYQLCRAWMRGNLKEEENWIPVKIESPPEDSIPVHLLATRDLVSLPRALSPYEVEMEWPDRDTLDEFNKSVNPININGLREEYQRHWKNVKRSFINHTRLRANRYHKSRDLLTHVYMSG